VNGSRRVYRRPYFFEVFAAAHFIFILIMVAWRGPNIMEPIWRNVGASVWGLFSEGLMGVILRGLYDLVRGKGRLFIRSIANVGWLTDSVRLLIFASLLVGVYGAIKLVVPIYHPALYDQALWELDRAMFGGYAPVVFTLNVFSSPRVLTFFDAAYAKIFFTSLGVAFTFFMSHPSRRIRIAFADGNAALWIIGAWLYMLVPSIGPAYFFPDIWMAVRDLTPITNSMHRVLMINYQNVLKLKKGIEVPIVFMYGVAAFPSLHVGFQTFTFFWMRRVWVSGQVLFGVFTFLIVLGSMITGWHYLIDGIAGMLLAYSCYKAASRAWNVSDWARLRAAIAR
jgi:hypothetical protein